MRLLVTVTVLYLVTSGVYSRYNPFPEPNPNPKVKFAGCQVGDKCERSEECARGLKCVFNSLWGSRICQPGGDNQHKKSCNHNGHQFQHGQSYTYWDGCRVCVCNDGVSKCRVKKRCRYSGIYKKSCYHNGQEIKQGQRVMIECNYCTCYNGNLTQCTKMDCWRDGKQPVSEWASESSKAKSNVR